MPSVSSPPGSRLPCRSGRGSSSRAPRTPDEAGSGTRLAGEAVAVLGQHHGDATGSHEVPHAVHTWPLQACAALTGVSYLLEDLVAFSGGVSPQGFDLLGERVA